MIPLSISRTDPYRYDTPMTATRSHTCETTLPLPAPLTFAMLLTPSAICQWWSASRAIILRPRGDTPGTWAAAWGDDEDEPDFITVADITTLDIPRKLVLSNYRYHSRDDSLPFHADFTTTFDVEPVDDRRSILRVCQAGFPTDPVADDFYAACETGWHNTFKQIDAYAAEVSRLQ